MTSVRAVEVWAEGLADLVAEGKIRAVGVSNYSKDQLRRTHAVLQRKGVPLASQQVEFSLLRNNIDHNGMLQLCKVFKL